MMATKTGTTEMIAVLYQALSSPVIGGLRKDAKPGGCSDSGADIAAALAANGHHVVAPKKQPDPAKAFDWVYPDTADGIAAAMAAGASVLWTNTVLFGDHPLKVVASKIQMVGR